MNQPITSQTSYGKKGRSITSVSQHRLGIFRPVKQLQGELTDVSVENSWGKCILPKCQLTQVHACLIESMFFTALRAHVTDDNAVGLLVVIPSVLRAMGKSTRNHTWFYSKIAELQSQKIHAEFNNVTVSSYVIRKTFEYKNMERETGKVIAVIFEREYAKFFLQDEGIFYPPYLLKVIANLPGPAQAIVRFCWTHARGVLGETIQAILRGHLQYFWSNARDENKCVKKIMASVDEIQKTGVKIDGAGRVWFDKKNGVGYLKPGKDTINYTKLCTV